MRFAYHAPPKSTFNTEFQWVYIYVSYLCTAFSLMIGCYLESRPLGVQTHGRFFYTISVTGNITCRSCKTPQAYIDLFISKQRTFFWL